MIRHRFQEQQAEKARKRRRQTWLMPAWMALAAAVALIAYIAWRVFISFGTGSEGDRVVIALAMFMFFAGAILLAGLLFVVIRVVRTVFFRRRASILDQMDKPRR